VEKAVAIGAGKRREAIKAEITQIYKESYQNYGAPKITQKLQQRGKKYFKIVDEIISVN
jgi:hypothetical protein